MKPLYSTPVMFRPMKEEPAGHHWSGMKSYKMHLKIMQTSKGPYLRVSHTIKENPVEDGVQWIKFPYRPGEKCYVREAWEHIGNECHPGTTVQACVVYRDGETKLCGSWPDFVKAPGRKWWNSGKVVWFSPVTMPAWAARRFVVILSCEPIRVKEVTEEDIIKAGLADGSCVWANGAARCNAKGDLVVNQFMDNWRKSHPDKEWAWRTISKEIKS